LLGSELSPLTLFWNPSFSYILLIVKNEKKPLLWIFVLFFSLKDRDKTEKSLFIFILISKNLGKVLDFSHGARLFLTVGKDKCTHSCSMNHFLKCPVAFPLK
jgi:hypothetical protein